MIDNGNGTFTITNNRTGENRTVLTSDLPKYGLKAPGDSILGMNVNNVDKNKVGALENTIGKTGIFDVPLLGGLARAMTHPILKGGEVVGQALGELGAAGLGQTSAPQIVSPEFQNVLNNRTQAGSEGFVNPNGTSQDIAFRGAKTAAGVAAYGIPGGGFVPGGGNAALATAKGITAAGALSATGESKGQDLLQVLPDALKGGAISLGTYGAVKGVEKGLGFLNQKLSRELPESVRKSADLVQQKKQLLEEESLHNQIGRRNADQPWLVKLKGNNPEQTISNVSDKQAEISHQLNQLIADKYAPAGDFTEGLRAAVKSVPPSPISSQSRASYVEDVQNYLDDIVKESYAEQLHLTNEQAAAAAADMADGKSPIPLSVVQAIKTRLGEGYGDPAINRLYSYTKNFIEEQSGHQSEVAALNSQYQKLLDVKDFARTASGKAIMPIELLNPAHPTVAASLDKLTNMGTDAIAGLLGYVGGSAMGGGLGLPGIGVGYMGSRALRAAAKDPQVMNALATILSLPSKGADSAIGSGALKALETALIQAGVRVPTSNP